MPHSPEISLIICTRNRSRQLARCLESVREVRCERAWELVIVDNGSADDTSAVVQEFIRNTPVSVVYALEPEPGKSRGLNTALRMARGEIVAFTDDDCYPAPDFLARTWEAFLDPSVGYITGRILLHDPTDFPFTINESTTPLTFPSRKYLRLGRVQGANLAFRRRVLIDIGGFDPRFGPGTRYVVEDHDAAVRASATGWIGRYCPEVVVRHHHGRKRPDISGIVKLYAMGFGAHHVKMLLEHKNYALFLRTVLHFVRACTVSPRWAFWEAIGAMRYLADRLADALHRRYPHQFPHRKA
jgi:glycosyltransferase involved in cell wall biosynthesis